MHPFVLQLLLLFYVYIPGLFVVNETMIPGGHLNYTLCSVNSTISNRALKGTLNMEPLQEPFA